MQKIIKRKYQNYESTNKEEVPKSPKSIIIIIITIIREKLKAQSNGENICRIN